MFRTVGGRVATIKHNLHVTFEGEDKVRVFSDEGFEMTIDKSKKSLTTASDPYGCCGDRFYLPPEAITNNVTACQGYFEDDDFRVDAVDQEEFAWFWVSVVSYDD